MAQILVIDDDHTIRTTIQSVLTRAGHEVETTPYLATAIGEALLGKYDLITLDLSMPGVSGEEIANLFNFRELDTPVLVISANLSNSVTKELTEIGIKHFLPKPFEFSGLVEAVTKAISSDS